VIAAGRVTSVMIAGGFEAAPAARGVQPDHQPYAEYYAECLDEIAEADRLGFDTVWMSEHHLTPEEIADRLVSLHRELRFDHVAYWARLSGLPHSRVMHCLNLVNSRVLPALTSGRPASSRS
jgi:hypothetical protein